MTIAEIKELIELFNASGVAELEVQRGEDRVRIRRAGTIQEYSTPMPAGAAPGVAGVAQPPAQPSSAPGAATKEPESTDVIVRSPIVGTYYDAPAPGAAPFVQVGDQVEPGQVLCIIESMKLMNEIEAEVAGTVTSKLVENGRPVEYGEALFALRPR